jgi:hypothetical protein
MINKYLYPKKLTVSKIYITNVFENHKQIVKQNSSFNQLSKYRSQEIPKIYHDKDNTL